MTMWYGWAHTLSESEIADHLIQRRESIHALVDDLRRWERALRDPYADICDESIADAVKALIERIIE